jgi:Mn2+/Fe2+ NRAMP family transporter
MATSAIGPGFLTQTVVFTDQLRASFGFVILMSILIDLAAQLNIWRVLVAARVPAQTLANQVLPGLGSGLSVLVALGGLAFNIGNVAGAGLGLNALLGMPDRLGAAISAALAIALFLSREAGRAMDRFAQAMGAVMIVLASYVATGSHPPIAEAAVRSILPIHLDALAIVTIVGGTVGGYITFAGAHRLLDAGVAGPEAVGQATRSAGLGIGVASLMRVVLFLAALGVVSQGLKLDPANPPASVFGLAAGKLGYRVFGMVMWAAAMTSIVGSAYTSVTFIRTLRASWERHSSALIIAFIAVSTVVFVSVGRPVMILILVGALNGLILPVGLAAMVVASYRGRLLNGYVHPRGLAAAGAVVALVMAALGAYTMVTQVPLLVR